MDNRTQLYQAVSRLKPGDSLPLQAPRGANFETFRVMVFKMMQGFPDRKEITISASPYTATLTVKRKARLGNFAIGATTPPGGTKAPATLLGTPGIDDEAIRSMARAQIFDEAPEEIHNIYKKIMILKPKEVIEQMGNDLCKAENLHALYIYLHMKKPWNVFTSTEQEEDTTTRQSSLFEQVLEMGENEEAEEEKDNDNE